jgi:TolB protein
MPSVPYNFFLLLFLSLGLALCTEAQTVVEKLKRLTNVIDSYPMPSPNGKKVAFQSNRTGDWEIFVMNLDGSDIRQLTHSSGFDGGPIWSPDGKKIVFPSERDHDPEIYIMDFDGANQKRLTNIPGDDSHPHWFPDGTRIIFNSPRTSPDMTAPWGKQWHEIFSMNVDGSGLKQITHFKTVCTYPSVSPDGKKIVFRKVVDGPAFNWDLSINDSNRDSEVFVMDVDSNNLTNLSVSPAFDGWPWWSPDSRQIVFASNRSGPANVGQLFVVNTDGTGLRKITDAPASLAQPNWSKDGKLIYAFQSWETSEYEYGNVVVLEVGDH